MAERLTERRTDNIRCTGILPTTTKIGRSPQDRRRHRLFTDGERAAL
jgi:hypothetical protein